VRGLSDSEVRVRNERERVLGGGLAGEPDPAEIRADIASSWRRCQLIGMEPTADEVPYNPEFDRPNRLLRAATPVLDRLAEQLLGGPATIILADSEAQIIDRRAGGRELSNALDRASVAPGFRYAEEFAGTNGIGTALEERKPFLVRGGEHFRDNLQEFTCVGAPVLHPVTRAVEGVLDVTSRFADTNVLMKPLVLAAIRDIEARMYAHSSLLQRKLLEEFLRVTRRTSAAVVSLNEDFVISNTAASTLLDPSDQALLWDWAATMLTGRDDCTGEVRLARDVVQARAKRVDDAGRVAGVVVELRPRARARGAGTPAGPRAAGPGERGADGPSGVLPGRSAAWERLRQELDAVAGSALPVLVCGEPGSGKLYVAEHLHRRWCPGTPATVLDAYTAQEDPDGWFGRFLGCFAGGGTVILQHLDNLPAQLASRLIGRLGQEPGRRLVATAVSRAGAATRLLDHFPASVVVPPLRYRVEDIADLASVLLRRHAGATPVPRLEPGTLQTLRRLDWPGNVRELEMVLTGALLRSRGADVKLEHLPPEYRSAPVRHRMAWLERAERDVILEALADTGGNKLATAERLGIARSTLYRKMRALGIDEKRLSG
jgi:transcriptional regulator of acetoin/glycerol metabolism